ncbi:hypothetical protein, partial [Vibrio alginolyticus]|uniref:hypothetical protein n=1 Tax=Vibrio alginolyticus TaxID=663 RepID=UPI0038CD8F82
MGRGSIYLYLHQQLLAHYNLQRIANGLGPIEEVNFEHVKVPFQPHVTLLNGLQLTGRSEDVTLTHLNQQLVRNI